MYLNANLRVVSTVSPRDMTVIQLLHNKPITVELTANLALAELDLIHIAPLPLQGLCNGLLTKREDVIRRFFETMAATTCLTIEVLPTPTRSDVSRRAPPDTIAQLDDLPLDMLVNAGALQQRWLLHIVRTAPAPSRNTLRRWPRLRRAPTRSSPPRRSPCSAPPPSSRRSPARPASLHSKPATSPSTR